jgi:hypothetical protein
VAGPQQVFENDGAARRVPHPFADHSVEDPHVGFIAPNKQKAGRLPTQVLAGWVLEHWRV